MSKLVFSSNSDGSSMGHNGCSSISVVCGNGCGSNCKIKVFILELSSRRTLGRMSAH